MSPPTRRLGGESLSQGARSTSWTRPDSRNREGEDSSVWEERQGRPSSGRSHEWLPSRGGGHDNRHCCQGDRDFLWWNRPPTVAFILGRVDRWTRVMIFSSFVRGVANHGNELIGWETRRRWGGVGEWWWGVGWVMNSVCVRFTGFLRTSVLCVAGGWVRS